jgi:hypothetical protein
MNYMLITCCGWKVDGIDGWNSSIMDEKTWDIVIDGLITFFFF